VVKKLEFCVHPFLGITEFSQIWGFFSLCPIIRSGAKFLAFWEKIRKRKSLHKILKVFLAHLTALAVRS
jgi:hypothetical protein